MRRLYLLLCLSIVFSSHALAFEAQTMLINTTINNTDVKLALTDGLTVSFDQTFPGSQFGVYVLVDKAREKVAGQDMIYILLGLCKIKSDGTYTLPIFSVSTNLPFQTSSTEKAQIVKRLTLDANSFAQVMIANAAKIKAAEK
jgi:hypothetical protein